LATVRVNIPTAAVLVEYALAPAEGRMPDADDTLTMQPQRGVMPRIASFGPKKMPSRQLGAGLTSTLTLGSEPN
jgi:hypothetical protein